MNYPDLIWRLIELVLQKEEYNKQEIDKNNEYDKPLNANVHDETL